MLKAKCLVVEDSPTHAVLVKARLKAGGHTVVAEAATEKAALDFVGQLESLGVTVAILDGNLVQGRSDGRDGERISKAIRALGRGIHIVCVSRTSGGYSWADHNVSKFDLVGSENVLANLIDHL